MSDTPRTDAEIQRTHSDSIDPDFTRQLERELNERIGDTANMRVLARRFLKDNDTIKRLERENAELRKRLSRWLKAEDLARPVFPTED